MGSNDIPARVRSLETGYVDVKSSLAELHTKVDFLVTAVTEMKDDFKEQTKRVDGLDRWQAKAAGIAFGVSGVVSLLTTWLFNFFRLKGHH